MRSHSGLSSNTGSANQLRSQPFLVLPLERAKFALLFVLATGFGWFLVDFSLRPLQSSTLPVPWQVDGMLGSFVSGLVSGLVVGAMQWLILRRYVPDWLWIVANSAGYVLLMTTLQGWQILLEQGVQNRLVAEQLFAFAPYLNLGLMSLIGTLLTTICTIWLGLAQWLVLRQYARPSWHWLFVPSIAVVLASSLYGISLLLTLINIPLILDARVLGAGILGTTQAVALCSLKKFAGISTFPNHPLLVTAPEIRNYGQLRAIAGRLRTQLSQTWTNAAKIDHPLTYLVGATETGEILAYEPVHSLSRDAVNQTPLPDLTVAPDFPPDCHPPMARFRVTFLPSGNLKLLSDRGIPIIWLGLALLLLTIFASVAVRYGSL